MHVVQLMPLHPRTPSSLASFTSRLVLRFCYRLTQAVKHRGASEVMRVNFAEWCSDVDHEPRVGIVENLPAYDEIVFTFSLLFTFTLLWSLFDILSFAVVYIIAYVLSWMMQLFFVVICRAACCADFRGSFSYISIFKTFFSNKWNS